MYLQLTNTNTIQTERYIIKTNGWNRWACEKEIKNKRKIIITMKIAMKNDNEKHLIGNRDGKVAKARERAYKEYWTQTKQKQKYPKQKKSDIFLVLVFFCFLFSVLGSKYLSLIGEWWCRLTGYAETEMGILITCQEEIGAVPQCFQTGACSVTICEFFHFDWFHSNPDSHSYSLLFHSFGSWNCGLKS